MLCFVIKPFVTYESSSSGTTGHAEALEVVYNPEQISYEELLNHFWKHVDPLDGEGQFCDRGSQYRSAIFYQNDQERIIAERTRVELAKKLNAEIKTEIVFDINNSFL